MNFMLANLLLAILPPTRWFGVKRAILRRLGIRIGDGTRVCGHVRFYGKGIVTIGQDSWVGPGTEFHTAVGGDIIIGNHCDIAPAVAFVTGSHEPGDTTQRAGRGTAAPIVIGRGSWIGVRATILGGTEIGAGTMIAAGSLVLPRIWPADTLLMGTPARIARSLDDMR